MLNYQKENILLLLIVMICGKNKLRLQINFMKKFKYNISHTAYNIIDENNKISDKEIKKFKL